MNTIEEITAAAAKLNPGERHRLFRWCLRSYQLRHVLFDTLRAAIALLPKQQRLIALVQLDSLREDVAEEFSRLTRDRPHR